MFQSWAISLISKIQLPTNSLRSFANLSVTWWIFKENWLDIIFASMQMTPCYMWHLFDVNFCTIWLRQSWAHAMTVTTVAYVVQKAWTKWSPLNCSVSSYPLKLPLCSETFGSILKLCELECKTSSFVVGFFFSLLFLHLSPSSDSVMFYGCLHFFFPPLSQRGIISDFMPLSSHPH